MQLVSAKMPWSAMEYSLMMARLYAATKSDAQLPQSCRTQAAPRQQETLTPRSLKIWTRYRFNLQWHSDDTNKVSSSVNSWINFVTCLIVLHPNGPRPAKWIPNAIWRLERSDTHPLEGMWFPAKKARSPFRGSSNDHCMTAEDGSNLASAESTSIEEWWRMKHGNFKDHMMFHLFNVLDPSSATSFIIFQNPLSFTFHAIMKQFMNKEVLHPHTPSAP